MTCALVPRLGLDPIRSGALRAKGSRKPSDAILEAGRWGWITADSESGSRMGRVTEEAMAVASGKRLHGAFAWSGWPRSADSPVAKSLPGCSF